MSDLVWHGNGLKALNIFLHPPNAVCGCGCTYSLHTQFFFGCSVCPDCDQFQDVEQTGWKSPMDGGIPAAAIH